MDRRSFFRAMAAAGAALDAHLSWAADLPSDLRITRVVAFDLVTARNKFEGKNARRDDHGDRASDRMARILTSAGIEGIGYTRANREVLAGLLGKDPLAFFRRAERRMESPLGTGTMALWDIAGKVLGKPVWSLLGGAGPARVPVYDGSIYFADLLPRYADRWADRFKEEIDMGLALGHRAFKVKIGRGAKWMEAEAGYKRDIEVLEVVRAHAGRDIAIGVDANDGYTLPRAKQLLDDLPEFGFAYFEEMFPETVEACLDLKAAIAKRGAKTLVADGEGQSRPEGFKPYIAAKAIDILQGDMNLFGIEGILTEAAWAEEQGLRVAPHNWGSLIGFYQQLQVGRAIPNFYSAEHDPLATPVLVAEGYSIRDGAATVPDAPGFGLRIDEARFAAEAKVLFELKA